MTTDPVVRRVEQVLLVDDYEMIVKYWRRELNKLGAASSHARTADEALPLARATSPQLAVVDLFLGERSGLDVVEQLIEFDPTLTVVLVSADLPERHAVYAMHIGARWACAKPFAWPHLIALAEGHRPSRPALTDVALDFDTRTRQIIQRSLAAAWGNKTHAAERLAIHRTSLCRKCDKLGVRMAVPDLDDP